VFETVKWFVGTEEGIQKRYENSGQVQPWSVYAKDEEVILGRSYCSMVSVIDCSGCKLQHKQL